MKRIVALTEQAVVLEQRTCSRCGSPFMTLAAKVCPACRKRALSWAEIKQSSAGKELTLRQKHLANLVAQGLSNKEIAFELKLTYGTIKEYVSILFVKLGVRNRTELALRWQRHMDSASS